MSTARAVQFPLPIASTVEQLYVLASSQGYGREDDAAVIKALYPNRPEGQTVKAGLDDSSAIDSVVNQLCAIHIAVGAEAIAFAGKLNLDKRLVFDILSSAAASSRMFVDRVPRMLDSDWTSGTTLANMTEDLGTALVESKGVKSFCPISAIVHSIYLSVDAQGYAQESDAGVIRHWPLAA